MSDPGESGKVPARRFSEEQVAEIIRRAIRLQEARDEVDGGEGSGKPEAAGSLSLADVRQIAAEVGVDPRFVDLAVSGAGAETEKEGSVLAGASYSWRIRRVVDGEIPEEERGRILDAIRAVMRTKGEVEDLYDRMEWSYDDGLGAVIVAVTSRDGTSRIEVTARRATEVGVWQGVVTPLVGILGGAVVAATLDLPPSQTLLPVVGLAGLAFVGVRQAWKFLSRMWERKLNRLADRVAHAAATAARQALSQTREEVEDGT